MIKKYLPYILMIAVVVFVIGAGLLFWKNQPQVGASVYFPYQGGTGIGSATAGDVGKYLKVSGNAPFTYSFDTPAGGIGSGTLGTSTPLTISQLLYVTDTGYPSRVSSVATTTLTEDSTALSFSQPVTIIGSSASILSLSTAGDWTGTFDSQEGSYYLNAANLTNFGTPFYSFFNATNTDALSQGSTNFYASQTRLDNYLSATSSIASITTLPRLSITKSQVSDFGTYLTSIGSGTNGQLTYWIGPNTLTGIATTTPNFGLGLTAGGTWNIIGSAPTLNLASTSIFSGTVGQIPYFSGTNTLIGTSTIIIGTDGVPIIGQGTEVMRITGGNVGIGTTSPYAKLSVTGASNQTNPLFIVDYGTGTVTTTAFSINSTGVLSWNNASSTLLSSTYASSTFYQGAGLTNCTGKLLWSNGRFSCGTDAVGSGSGTISTSSSPTIGGLAYWTSKDAWPETQGSAATTTLTGNAPIVFSQPVSVIGVTASVITCNAASGAQAGCLSAANWTTFNGKQDALTFTYPLVNTAGTVTFPATSTLYGTGSYGNFLMWNGEPKWTATSTLFTYPWSVANGGTGANNLTGVLKGNGTAAFTVAANGTDFTLVSAQTCTNQVITALTASGGSTCSSVSNAMLSNSTISGVALGSNLANLTATNGSLTFSVTYNGSAAATIGLNMGNANTWTAKQTFANSSTTLASFDYASSTAAYFGSVTMTGDFTPNANFGGRSITVNGSAVDADSELYTHNLATFNVGSSTMSTTTGTFLQKLVANAATITGIWCSSDVGTSTIMLEERDPADPNAAGTDILFAGGLRCGSGSGQTASSTMANNSLDANDIINLEIIDAAPVGGTKPTKIFIHVKGTFND